MTSTRLGRCIGLTGGIACGKSTVAEIFAERGVSIVDTDLISRAVVAPPSPWLDQLVETFGTEILQDDGRLDRAVLRQRIFHDPQAKTQVEAILHPAIRQQAYTEAQAAAASHSLVLIVVPLLAEPGVATHYAWLDRVIGVRCTPAIQRERLRARVDIDPAQADRMLAAQVSDEARMPLVTDWLVNNGSRESIQQQVIQLHHALLNGSM